MNYDCARIQTALKNNEPLTIRDELALHLNDCEACAALLDAKQGVKPLLQRVLVNDDVAPAALRARIRHKLQQQQMAQTVWQRLR